MTGKEIGMKIGKKMSIHESTKWPFLANKPS